MGGHKLLAFDSSPSASTTDSLFSERPGDGCVSTDDTSECTSPASQREVRGESQDRSMLDELSSGSSARRNLLDKPRAGRKMEKGSSRAARGKAAVSARHLRPFPPWCQERARHWQLRLWQPHVRLELLGLHQLFPSIRFRSRDQMCTACCQLRLPQRVVWDGRFTEDSTP